VPVSGLCSVLLGALHALWPALGLCLFFISNINKNQLISRFGDYVLHQGDGPKWPGIALFAHTFLIFLSSLIYKFGRTEEHWE
jgi:hypothetical protein